MLPGQTRIIDLTFGISSNSSTSYLAKGALIRLKSSQPSPVGIIWEVDTIDHPWFKTSFIPQGHIGGIVSKETPQTCPGCNSPFVSHGDGMVTLVGYTNRPGHDHDDNCTTRPYICSNGHVTLFSTIPKCYKEGCGWVGKIACFCSYRVPSWPEIKE